MGEFEWNRNFCPPLLLTSNPLAGWIEGESCREALEDVDPHFIYSLVSISLISGPDQFHSLTNSATDSNGKLLFTGLISNPFNSSLSSISRRDRRGSGQDNIPIKCPGVECQWRYLNWPTQWHTNTHYHLILDPINHSHGNAIPPQSNSESG